MTNTLTTNRPASRVSARVALAVAAAITIATATFVTANALGDNGTPRQFPQVTAAAHTHDAPTPGNGVPCPIRQAC